MDTIFLFSFFFYINLFHCSLLYFFIVVQFQLSPFPPIALPCPIQHLLPKTLSSPLSLSVGPLYLFPSFLLLSPSPLVMSVCSLFPCLWFFCAHLFCWLRYYHCCLIYLIFIFNFSDICHFFCSEFFLVPQTWHWN